MRIIVRAISVLFFIYFIFASVGAVFGLYLTYSHLFGANDFKLVFGYPLFLEIMITIMAPIGLISSIGLYFYKNWGRYFANFVLASTIVLFTIKLFEKYYPDNFGYTLLESDGSYIFFSSSFNWEVILSTTISVFLLFLLNTGTCKRIFSS